MTKPRVLTIAGSDSSGGAGIQADLRTLQTLGVYGLSAITAVTAQNTRSVDDILEIPAELVAAQIDAVMDDMGTAVWKTGMLGSSDIVEIVASRVKSYKVKKLVVDPVMVASSGRRLLARNAIETMINKLLPLTLVITPNIPEAEVLTGFTINSFVDMKKAAIVLHKMGARSIVIKGGHLIDQRSEIPSKGGSASGGKDQRYLKSVDILYDGQKFYEFEAPWVQTEYTRGTGCTFASAVAAELAHGKTIHKAVKVAKDYVYSVLIESKKLEDG